MKHNFLFLLLLFPLLAHPQLSENVQQLYTEFSESAKIQDPDAPVVMNRENYARFRKITNTATEEELLHLEKIGDIVVREYIIKELVDRKSAALESLFEQYLADPKVASYATATEVYDWNPAIEVYASIAHQKEKLERRKYYEQTTSKGLLTDVKQLFGAEYDTEWTVPEVDAILAKLDVLAFANDSTAPQVLNHIFRYRQFKVSNYSRIRYFADKYPTAEILATLANFKNQKDLPFLQQHIDRAFLAVALFPHPSFLPELKKRLDSEYGNVVFQEAISSYCNVDSRNLLDTICKKITINYPDGDERQEKLFALYGIMERQNYNFYKPVLTKIDSLLN
ncbi:MAG TPA: hypothetical protein VF676_08905 [Flavobacterium sp.]|jgi:hypothetical protein